MTNPETAINNASRPLSRSAEILETRRRLDDLLQQVRRKTIFASIEAIDPSNMQSLWRRLTPAEKEDCEIVYKILATGTHLFGPNPWDRFRNIARSVRLPPKFELDPDAAVAYFSSEKIQWCVVFNLPESLGDDKRVMMAICSKSSESIHQASMRLRDDEELIRHVLLPSNRTFPSFSRAKHLEYASERLRKDKTLILDLFERTVVEQTEEGDVWYGGFLWLEYAMPDLEDEEEVVRALLGYASQEGIPNKLFAVTCLKHFSEALRDDKVIMLQFVKLHWRSFQHCSERLRSDEEMVNVATSKCARAYRFALGDFQRKYTEGRTICSVMDEIADGAVVDIPETMKTNRTVVLAAVKAGLLDVSEFRDLQETIRHDKEVLLAYVRNTDGTDFWREASPYFYRDLPDHLQRDEDVALALLEANYECYEDIFEKIPDLCRSREAMVAIIDIYHDAGPDRFPSEFIARCSFRDDIEFMLAAYSAFETDSIIRHASDRLLSSRDFMEAASRLDSCAFIAYAPAEFQLENMDLVVKAIENSSDIYVPSYEKSNMWLFTNLDSDVWNQQAPILAWLNMGWPILEVLKDLHPESSFLSDREVVALSVANSPSELVHASSSLQNDREFILSLVRQTEGVLPHAPREFGKDDEILVAAIAKSGGATIVDCFKTLKSAAHVDFLCRFAERVRSKLDAHDAFVNQFLRGISMTDQYGIALTKRSCHLPMLDRGVETSTALKRSIAEYAGVPISSDFQSLCATSVVLDTFGFY